MKIEYLARGSLTLLLSFLALLSSPRVSFAQAPGVPIERGTVVAVDKLAIESASALRAGRKLLAQGEVAALIAAPRPEKFALPPPQTRALPAREIYKRARGAFLRIGWLYRPSPDEAWELDVSNAYAIAEGGIVATAAHTLEGREGIDEAYLVALTADNQALVVTSILAVDRQLDAAVVRVAGFTGKPLPLSEDVSPGDRAYCFSDPYEERGFFATGTVNRFYWCDADDGDLQTLAGIRNLRFDVSTEWAPGSSGAAILDGAGNAIGHACSITSFTFPPDEVPLEEILPEDEAEPADVARTSPTPAAPAAEANEAAGGEASDDAPSDDLSVEEALDGDAFFQIQSAVPARGVRLLVKGAASGK